MDAERDTTAATSSGREVSLPARETSGDEELTGDLAGLDNPGGLVVFVHGSGSSRHSPRNVAVAERLNETGLATLLLDLLTPRERLQDELDGRLRFDVELLTARVLGVLDWISERAELRNRPLGLFGASTGAAAALGAAARRPHDVRAVVSRGGRPDLTTERVAALRAPTLLIVGERDSEVLRLNENVARHIPVDHEVHRVPGATHLFEENGALLQVAEVAGAWFSRYLSTTATA
ncbi:Dienelactone hydrolase [Actinopolyspora lacussalsi subsp. righensis]|uniref:Dienelactone hydrolase n=1 Tax=Actinopolyspora righensis TaxID=995060 RepID=A0A1I7ASL3_9ACTN|nr:alpha/beta fold hydrolase [Actinopolyspora righensis]SFT77949.1 Dienelactone hydrolase [Actinopolyspora righensis]